MTAPWGTDPTSDPTVAIPVDPTDVQPLPGPLELLVPEPGPPRSLPWPVLAGAAAGALIGGLGTWALLPRTVTETVRTTATAATAAPTSTTTTVPAPASTTGGVIQPLTPTTTTRPATRPKATTPATRTTTRRRPPDTTAATTGTSQ